MVWKGSRLWRGPFLFPTMTGKKILKLLLVCTMCLALIAGAVLLIQWFAA